MGGWSSTLSLDCVVVGERSPFTIKIESHKKVHELKKKIGAEKMYQFPSDELQLYSVDGLVQKTATQFHLKGTEIDDLSAKSLSDFSECTEDMVATKPLHLYPQLNDTFIGKIHVLVVLPQGAIKASDVASNAPIRTALPKGEKIELTPAGLSEFLRQQMKNPKDFKPFRPLLPESNLAFKLSGREKALNQAAHCMKRFYAPTRETTKADRKIPVCAGLSGVGKSRMLEEWEQIFDLAGVSGPRLAAIVRYYYHDHMHQAIERSMPIEASFSWRLLHQLFLQDNAVHLRDWFCVHLPQNAADLRLITALKVIRDKCIEMETSSPQETLQFCIGVDRYQLIQELNGDEAKEDLLQDLVDFLGAAMERPVYGIHIYPMLAGTDLSAISIVNSSKPEILRLSMPPLAPSEIETAVSSVVHGPSLLTDSPVRRHLFYIGGVPRWCFEYIELLLQKVDASGDKQLSTGDIETAFGIINQSFIQKWGNDLKYFDFIKLAAFSVSGAQVNMVSKVVGGMTWSRMQDCGLCLLTDDSKVMIPYAIFHLIKQLVPSQYCEVEECFITCVRGLIEKVDCLIYHRQMWELWKVFGAYFHALRINAFIIIGQPVIKLSDLFDGALMVGCDDEVDLLPTKVMKYDDTYGKNIQPEIGCYMHSSETHNWLTEGFVVINSENGRGVHIFFALKKSKRDGYVVCLDQRERVAGLNISQMGISKLLRAARIEPEALGVEYGPITVVPMLFSSLRSTNIQELTEDNAVVVTHAQMKAYHHGLWVHPAALPWVNVNKDPATCIKMVLVGDSNDVKTVAQQLVMGKRKFESVDDFRSAVKRICARVELSDEGQIEFS